VRVVLAHKRNEVGEMVVLHLVRKGKELCDVCAREKGKRVCANK